MGKGLIKDGFREKVQEGRFSSSLLPMNTTAFPFLLVFLSIQPSSISLNCQESDTHPSSCSSPNPCNLLRVFFFLHPSWLMSPEIFSTRLPNQKRTYAYPNRVGSVPPTQTCAQQTRKRKDDQWEQV